VSAGYRVCRRCDDAFYPAHASHYLCRACWKADRDRRAARRRVSELEEDLLRGAIALTHPDRHPVERRDEATRITQRLLEARRRAT
jgi:hypothetical protein